MATVKRYRVKFKYVKFKGVMYQAGELLPSTFSEKDRFRNIYPSRIEQVDVEEPDKEEGVQEIPPATPSTPPVNGANDNTSKEIITPNKPLTGSNPGLNPVGLKPGTPLVRTPLTNTGAQPKV